MDVTDIMAENTRLKNENMRLKNENARLLECLRDARDLNQRLDKETRPHSAPLDLPERSRLFSSSSASPDTNDFLRKLADKSKRTCSVSPDTDDYLRRFLENPCRRDSE